MTKTPTILGHVPCPICDNKTAEVRLDRNELAYIYCSTGCYTQVFTRDKQRDAMLRARMRPIAAAAAEASAPTPTPAPGPVPVPAVAATPTPTSQPAKRAWLTTLLDTGPAK